MFNKEYYKNLSLQAGVLAQASGVTLALVRAKVDIDPFNIGNSSEAMGANA